MKTYTIYAVLLILSTLLSCSTSSKLTRDQKNGLRQVEVNEALTSQDYIIKVDRMNPRRTGMVQLREDYNFIVVRNDHARMSLAYAGRSYDIRGISGINMSGDIIEKKIEQKKKGATQVNLKVKQNTDTFNVNIHISKTGSCNIYVSHPRIDGISYQGNIFAMK